MVATVSYNEGNLGLLACFGRLKRWTVSFLSSLSELWDPRRWSEEATCREVELHKSVFWLPVSPPTQLEQLQTSSAWFVSTSCRNSLPRLRAHQLVPYYDPWEANKSWSGFKEQWDSWTWQSGGCCCLVFPSICVFQTMPAAHIRDSPRPSLVPQCSAVSRCWWTNWTFGRRLLSGFFSVFHFDAAWIQDGNLTWSSTNRWLENSKLD